MGIPHQCMLCVAENLSRQPVGRNAMITLVVTRRLDAWRTTDPEPRISNLCLRKADRCLLARFERWPLSRRESQPRL